MSTDPEASAATQKLRDRFRFIDDMPDAEGSVLESVLVVAEESATGRECCLKLWRKTGSALDEDLRLLWFHEFRQVDRLMAHAGAHEVIVDVLELIEDPQFFAVVTDRLGLPLSDLRKRVPRIHWLNNLGTAHARALMWKNIRRLAFALGLVHGQGLMHGRLNGSSVVSEGAPAPDFRLAGFEWSLWVRADTPTHFHAGAQSDSARLAHSFVGDWRSLGILVLELFGAAITDAGEFEPLQPAAEVDLTLPERQLLRRLVLPTRLDLLDSDAICQSIDDLVVGIGREMSSRAGVFLLAFARRDVLAGAVYSVSDQAIARDEYDQQLRWVRADLANGTTLFIPPGFDPAGGSMKLVSTSMIYSLRAFLDNGTPRWDTAVCDRVEVRQPRSATIRWQAHTLPQPIEVVATVRDATYARSRLGIGVHDWSGFWTQDPSDAVLTPINRVRQALILVQVLEAFIKAMEIYPVEIVSVKTTRARRTVALRARPGNDRDSTAKRFGLPDTASALKRLFDDDDRDADDRWQLSESSSLGVTRNTDIRVRFLDVTETDGGSSYLFEAEDALPLGRRYYVKTDQDRGSESVIQRRLRNIQALETRMDLVEMLDDPWRVRRRSREVLTAADRDDAAFTDLDASKQEALTAIWSNIPSFTVVGPPGVGKTRLATEVIRRRFSTRPATRMLLAAQGHDALNNLQSEVEQTLKANGLEQLILVRSTTPDSQPTGDAEVHRAAVTYLNDLAASPLVANAPPVLSVRVRELAAAGPALDRKEGVDKDQRSGLKAMSRLLLDAADIVVSTVNSPDIENLVEARDQFDWVIVEEAAKVTGPEMIGALSLSRRRLFIGDHHQLPPHQAELYTKVLGDAGLMAEVLRAAERTIGSLMRNDELEEMSALLKDPMALDGVIEQARRLFEPFRWIAEEDARRRQSRTDHRPISHMLGEQRRMDDAIAQVVGTFYPGGLKTETTRAVAELSGPRRFVHLAPMPRSPILVVDFPHVSATGRRAEFERANPRWHNPLEAEAVIEVLRHVRARPGESPKLAILSPYNAQVKHLRQRVEALMEKDLSHLKAFKPARTAGFVGTVDGFQGGEADLVVLSLVRNNARVGARALGFLRDRRRINVAISRAMSQLVIVGSRSFLREAVRGVNPDGSEQHELAFLTAILDKIDALRGQSRPDGTPLATVVTPGWSRPSR